MRIAAALLDQVTGHALREHPRECCGFVELGADGREAIGVLPARNIAADPLRFEVAPDDLMRVAEIEDRGHHAVIYHSHTRSAPEPSRTDVRFAAGWPGVPWLIVGTAATPPQVRCFEIDGGEVRDHPIEVV